MNTNGKNGNSDTLVKITNLKMYFPITEGVVIRRHVGDEARRDPGSGRRKRMR